ncbi:hypothetical protein RND81_10G125700, partial [Saponaria officinalis]
NSNKNWTLQQNYTFERGFETYHAECQRRLQQNVANIHAAPNDSLSKFPIFESSVIDTVNEDGYANKKGVNEKGSAPKRVGKGKEPASKQGENETGSHKGNYWTEEEHRQFLLGMQRYGKGDWKMIANEFVKTRTAVQIASHAQKYFKKLGSEKKYKRWSVFDVTLHSVQQRVSASASVVGVGTNDVISSQSELSMMVADKEPLVVNEVTNVEGPPLSPPLSPPESWCLDNDNYIFDLDFQECLSQLPP